MAESVFAVSMKRAQERTDWLLRRESCAKIMLRKAVAMDVGESGWTGIEGITVA